MDTYLGDTPRPLSEMMCCLTCSNCIQTERNPFVCIVSDTVVQDDTVCPGWMPLPATLMNEIEGVPAWPIN